MVLRMSGRRCESSCEFRDLGDAAVGRPEHPVFQLAPGLFERVSEQGAEEFPELPGAVELALGSVFRSAARVSC